jgi:hypothetical protein
MTSGIIGTIHETNATASWARAPRTRGMAGPIQATKASTQVSSRAVRPGNWAEIHVTICPARSPSRPIRLRIIGPTQAVKALIQPGA